MQRLDAFFGGLLLACAPLLVVGVGCSGGGGSTPAGTGGTLAGSGGTGPAGTGGQGGGGPTGTGGGSGGMPVIDANGSGGAPAGNDGPVAETHPDVAPSDGGGASAWTGTWAAAPDGTCNASVGQTIRMIVHTSIGGNAARVRVSNARGGGALHISNVHLAQRTTGSSIDVATDKALTFAGQPDVTVAAGMFALSDGADFVVKPTSDVAISFFVMSSSGGTCQQNPFQTNYSAAGNMVSAPTLNGGGGGYIYVLGLDVQNPAAEGAVVALGASITTGFIAGTDVNKRWPNLLAARLVAANRTIGVLNEGISGEGTSNALARFNRDVLEQTNVKWVIFSDDPINDLGRSTPAIDIGQMKMMIMMAHAKGVKFLCSTLTPFLPDEPKRAMVVDFIRSADSGCDGIIDQEKATSVPGMMPARWVPQLVADGGLHPNPAGMQAIADIVDLAIFK